MKRHDVERARVYAEALLNLAEYIDGRGSIDDLRLVLAAIIELQSLQAIPLALPDAQRAA
jgi:hypothetical protein